MWCYQSLSCKSCVPLTIFQSFFLSVNIFKEDHPRISAVLFHKDWPSCSGEEVVQRNCWQTDRLTDCRTSEYHKSSPWALRAQMSYKQTRNKRFEKSWSWLNDLIVWLRSIQLTEWEWREINFYYIEANIHNKIRTRAPLSERQH